MTYKYLVNRTLKTVQLLWSIDSRKSLLTYNNLIIHRYCPRSAHTYTLGGDYEIEEEQTRGATRGEEAVEDDEYKYSGGNGHGGNAEEGNPYSHNTYSRSFTADEMSVRITAHVHDGGERGGGGRQYDLTIDDVSFFDYPAYQPPPPDSAPPFRDGRAGGARRFYDNPDELDESDTFDGCSSMVQSCNSDDNSDKASSVSVASRVSRAWTKITTKSRSRLNSSSSRGDFAMGDANSVASSTPGKVSRSRKGSAGGGGGGGAEGGVIGKKVNIKSSFGGGVGRRKDKRRSSKKSRSRIVGRTSSSDCNNAFDSAEGGSGVNSSHDNSVGAQQQQQQYGGSTFHETATNNSNYSSGNAGSRHAQHGGAGSGPQSSSSVAHAPPLSRFSILGGSRRKKNHRSMWSDPLDEVSAGSWDPTTLRDRLRSSEGYCDESMVSQAITMAFLEPRDITYSRSRQTADYVKKRSSPFPSSLVCGVIEATCYHETFVYVKQRGRDDENGEPGVSETAYVQDKLNYLVALVRHRALQAEDAARIIHGVGCLLPNLCRTVSEPPAATVLVYGMRRNVAVQSLCDAFVVFGAVKSCNVADGGKGFGFVRFVSHSGVDRAMRRFERDEILVDDVAVVVQPLGNDGGSYNGSYSSGGFGQQQYRNRPPYPPSPSSSSSSSSSISGLNSKKDSSYFRPSAVTVTRSKVVMHASKSASADWESD